jgi:DNA-binding NtrC family response regulator
MEDKHTMFLIVDDEPDMCWAFEHILKKRGVITLKALTGAEAIELGRKNRFRMIFLDAKLPDIDGLELAKKIRRLDPRVPIVIVSGYFYAKDPIVADALAEGLICGFVGKPFDHNEIMRIIENTPAFKTPSPDIGSENQ